MLNEGDLADAVSTDGLSFNKEQYPQGEQYLFDNLSKIDSAILDGTVYLTFNSLDTDSGYDMTVTWESPNGVIGSYRNDFVGYNSTQTENNEDPENDYNTENDENTDERVDLSQANANAKIFFNCLAEYLADEYTMGRTYPTVLDEGDLALTTSPEGMPLDGEITAKGDSYLAQLVSVYDADMRHARVYAGFDVIEGEDEFDFFVQWMSEDGVIGQYPTPVREEYRDEVVFGTFCDR